jgi:hydroxyethylthiazole kinase-like sugar kinase family protein
MDATVLAQIAQALALLAANPALGNKGSDLAGIANLVALAFQVGKFNNDDRQALLAQIEEANAAGRGLTEEQRAGWKARHEAASSVIEQWQPE